MTFGGQARYRFRKLNFQRGRHAMPAAAGQANPSINSRSEVAGAHVNGGGGAAINKRKPEPQNCFSTTGSVYAYFVHILIRP